MTLFTYGLSAMRWKSDWVRTGQQLQCICGLATSIDLLPSEAVLLDMHSPARLWLGAGCRMPARLCFTGPHMHKEADKGDLSASWDGGRGRMAIFRGMSNLRISQKSTFQLAFTLVYVDYLLCKWEQNVFILLVQTPGRQVWKRNSRLSLDR